MNNRKDENARILMDAAETMEVEGNFTNFFGQGTVLYREVLWENGRPAFANLRYAHTPRGNHQYRIVADRLYTFGPVVVPDDRPGVVVFVDGERPNDWTHLVVEKAVNKRPKAGGFNTGFVLARYARPYEIGEYLGYRARVKALFDRLYPADNSGIQLMDVLLEYDALTPPERRVGELHLASVLTDQNTTRTFVHLDFAPPPELEQTSVDETEYVPGRVVGPTQFSQTSFVSTAALPAEVEV